MSDSLFDAEGDELSNFDPTQEGGGGNCARCGLELQPWFYGSVCQGCVWDAAAVLGALRRYRFTFSSEAQLQWAIEAALIDADLGFVREERLSSRDRIDFLCPVERVGIEVKVDGAVKAVEAQLARYAESDRVEELILVTACSRHGRVARLAGGKPVYVVPTFAGGF